MAQIHAVGQVADEGLEQRRPLHEHRQQPGLGLGQGQVGDEGWQERSQEGGVGIVHRVPRTDGEHAVGLKLFGLNGPSDGGGLSLRVVFDGIAYGWHSGLSRLACLLFASPYDMILPGMAEYNCALREDNAAT